MRRVAVVGSGRWARVLAEVLDETGPSTIHLDLHSPTRVDKAREWLNARPSSRIAIHETLPEYRGAQRPDAVIVANASRDHVAVATAAIDAGVPTLVEKPLAPSAASAARLVELAEHRRVLLAVSRVFLFARYIERFQAAVARCGGPVEVQVVWTDPGGEIRHGGLKRFDTSIPVPVDILPHVLPILTRLTGALPDVVNVLVMRGGLTVDLRMQAGDVKCDATLARHAPSRQRVVDVLTTNGRVRLDFSDEPGTITAGGTEYSGDSEWEQGPRPLARMLATFLDCAARGIDDERLSAAAAVDEIRRADKALQIYGSSPEPTRAT